MPDSGHPDTNVQRGQSSHQHQAQAVASDRRGEPRKDLLRPQQQRLQGMERGELELDLPSPMENSCYDRLSFDGKTFWEDNRRIACDTKS